MGFRGSRVQIPPSRLSEDQALLRRPLWGFFFVLPRAIRQVAPQTSKGGQHGPSIVELGSVHSHRPALLGSGRGWLDVLYDPPLDSTSGSRTSRDRRTKGHRHRRDDPDNLIYKPSSAKCRTALRSATGALDRVASASQAVRCAG